MHGAVGLVDTPSGAFVWCGWCWCCVAGGGPILLPALWLFKTPHPLSSYSPPNKMPWRPLSGAATRHPTTEPDPPIQSTVHSSEGGPVLTLLAALAGWVETASCADRATQGGRRAAACCCLAALLHGSQRHWFQPGGPRPLLRCDSGGPKEPLPRVAASSNGQPLFKGCMNTLIGGIAKFT